MSSVTWWISEDIGEARQELVGANITSLLDSVLDMVVAYCIFHIHGVGED